MEARQCLEEKGFRGALNWKPSSSGKQHHYGFVLTEAERNRILKNGTNDELAKLKQEPQLIVDPSAGDMYMDGFSVVQDVPSGR